MFPAQELAAWDPEPLREALQAAGYRGKNFRPLDGDGRILAADPGTPGIDLALRLFSSPAGIPRAAAESLLGAALPPLLELGLLVESDPGQIRSCARLEPDGDGWFASDHTGSITGRPDHVMGIGRSTRILGALAAAGTGTRALDLCSGAGWIALGLAKAGGKVTATDLSGRAVDFARFNARLAGEDSIEWLQGNLLEPVAGRQFDLITANPPFVLSPESTFTFRDSGLPGTAFVENLARSLPDHLAPDGIAIMLLSWYDDGRDENSSAPLEWTSDQPCNAWLFRTLTQDPAEYARQWLRDIHGGAPPPAADLERWISYLADLGARRVHTGFLILQRSDGPRWTRSDVRRIEQIRSDAGQDIQRVCRGENWLARHQPDERMILNTRFGVAPGLRAETVSQLDQQWSAIAIRLLSPGRLAYDGPVDAFLLQLLAHCKDDATPGEMAVPPAGAVSLSPDQFHARVALLCRELVRHGILLPPD
ncbi:methyltransferase [Luteolibacter marinus]|uniref:methyltransferase n=1 Tax=Luteolibacter marinus TaxID=2776705 RepID=UPI0018687C45|nr:methyltransferase [Luteolibacter marinus]